MRQKRKRKEVDTFDIEELEDEEESNYPVKVYPAPLQITTKTSDEVLFEEDVVRINQAIDMVHNISFQVTNLSSDEICRVALTTIKLLESRRKLLLKPLAYAPEDFSQTKNKIVYLD